MARRQLSGVIQHLRSALLCEGSELTDGQLLERFVSRKDEAAFALLVRRQGPMVWGVCRRVLVSHQDAEDAFQAVFLVLVRKAASIVPRENVARWLHGVAFQTALKARAAQARRKGREKQVDPMPEPAVRAQDLWSDLQAVLDQELARLPDKYQAAIVLCDLEGKTRKEAARELRVPEGTLSGLLTRGRVLLAKRLARHGLAVSGGSVAAVLAQHVASAGAPDAVVSSTIKLATLFAAGRAAAGAVSAPVAALTQGVLKTMLLKKLKAVATMITLVLGLAGLGGGLFSHLMAAAQPGADREAKPGAEAKSPANLPLADPLGAEPKGAEKLDLRKPDAPAIAWGKAIDGLQAGIRFRPGEPDSYQAGRHSVNVVIYLRNTSAKPIIVSYIETIFEEFLPTVEDASGKRYKVLNGPINLGQASSVKRTLETGEAISLGAAWFVIVPPGTKGVAIAPTLVAPPGKYRVSHGGFPLRRDKNDFDESRWPTGQIEMRIDAKEALLDVPDRKTGDNVHPANPPAPKPEAAEPKVLQELPDQKEPRALTLQQAVKDKLNQSAVVEFQVASATMSWTTGFNAQERWVIHLTPTVGLKDGSEFQICISSKAVTHLRNLGLLSQDSRKSTAFFRDKVVRLTGKIESYDDRSKRGATIYRICVFDLDHLVVIK